MTSDSPGEHVFPSVAKAILRDLAKALALEWLETNGLGDFACGTVAGVNTRREHGLFIAGGPKPMLLLAALDVAIERDGTQTPLSTHQFADVVHPEGYRLCARFQLSPFPEWRYEFPGGALTYRIFMPAGRRCVVASWELDADATSGHWLLKVRPLLAYRDLGALTHANLDAGLSLRPSSGGFSAAPYPGCPEMFVQCPGAAVRHDPVWYYRFLHAEDAAHGLEAEEDFFTPCELTYELAPGRNVWLIAGTEAASEQALPCEGLTEPSQGEPRVVEYAACSEPAERVPSALRNDVSRLRTAGSTLPAALEAQERARRAALMLPLFEPDLVSRILARAAEAFCVKPGHTAVSADIVAGYPNVSHNLRSGLIALPGILLATRRLKEAKSYLTAALEELRSRPALGDEALWFIRAAEIYIDHSRDWDCLRAELAPGCISLAERLAAEKLDSGLRLDSDGLLSCAGGAPLTWMDAVVDGVAVTPRAGKPVEVNALWHSALAPLARWAARLGMDDAAQRWQALRELCGRSFRRRFWNASLSCLFDIVDAPAGNDPAIRPNQLLAVALTPDLLERPQAAAVLEMAEKRLLLPCGLRSLSLEDPAFVPREASASDQYQGSAYPWLTGFYADAVFRVHGRTPRAYARIEAALEWLTKEHLAQGCMGQIAERFDGASPHAQRGLIAQAPAVGELIRAWSEVRGRGL